MREKTGRVGRPMKEGNESQVGAHISMSQEVKTWIKDSGKPVAYFLDIGVNAIRGNPDEKELMDLEKEISIREPELAMLKARRDLILAEKRRREEYARQKETETKYLHAVFSLLLKLSKKTGRITFYDNWIREQYGISFDVSLANRNFSEALEAIDLIPEYAVEKYSIRKVQKGQREEKMMVELMDREDEE